MLFYQYCITTFLLFGFFGPFLGEGPEWPQALYGRVRSNKKKKKHQNKIEKEHRFSQSLSRPEFVNQEVRDDVAYGARRRYGAQHVNWSSFLGLRKFCFPFQPH